MPRSMTGFGSAEDRVLSGRLRVDIRTVNHRYFNPQLKLPADLAGVEIELRERLRQLLVRGHVAVTARWVESPAPERGVMVDLARAKQVLAAAQQLKKKLKLKGTVDLAFVARHPDVLTATNGGSGNDQPVQWADVQAVVERAARDVVAMREKEGQALALELTARLAALESAAHTVEQQAPARLQAEHERLKQAVAELTASATVDEQRLALEIALLADRLDITEELVRFRAHVAAARAALASDQAVGKQLGFLAQELLREVNTMGSKANDARITQTVIAMKGDLEKFREQLENLE
ncbi:MAG: YicC/YloC family endoribonuclease [Gemmatimonadales bacterium]